MKTKNPQKAVHEALEIFNLIPKMDFDYSGISRDDRGIPAKKRFERKKRKLMGLVEKFIRSYRVSPIIGLDGDTVRGDFEGHTKGFRAGAKMHYSPLDPEWFEELTFPEQPRALKEVFA